jgi:hypothetical protein
VCERVYLHGRPDLAEALLAQWSGEDINYDIVRLILELSENIYASPLQIVDEGGADIEEEHENALTDEPPLTGEHWNEIDYETLSSDERDSSESGLETEISSLGILELDQIPIPTVSATSNIADALLDKQYWNVITSLDSGMSPIFISELDVIREVLFMLGGHPSELFLFEDTKVRYNDRYCLYQASSQSLHSSLNIYLNYGQSINICRKFASTSFDVKVLQACCDQMDEILFVFDEYLAQLQHNYILNHDKHISILDFTSRITSKLVPFGKLAQCIRPSLREFSNTSISLLQSLYDSAVSYRSVTDGDLVIKLFMTLLTALMDEFDNWIFQSNKNKNLRFSYDCSRLDSEEYNFSVPFFENHKKSLLSILQTAALFHSQSLETHGSTSNPFSLHSNEIVESTELLTCTSFFSDNIHSSIKQHLKIRALVTGDVLRQLLFANHKLDSIFATTIDAFVFKTGILTQSLVTAYLDKSNFDSLSLTHCLRSSQSTLHNEKQMSVTLLACDRTSLADVIKHLSVDIKVSTTPLITNCRLHLYWHM